MQLWSKKSQSRHFFWATNLKWVSGGRNQSFGGLPHLTQKSKADDWLPQFPCLVLGSRGVFFFFVVLFSMGLWVLGIMRPPWRHTIYSWKMISTLHQIGSPISQVQRERIQSSWHIMFMTCFRFWLPTLGTQNFETKIVFWIFFVPLKLLIWWVIQWWVKGRYPETHINIGKRCGE